MDHNGILDSAVRSAIEALADKGVEGVDTKEVILATFGSLSLHGGVAKNKQVARLVTEVKKFGYKIMGT